MKVSVAIITYNHENFIARAIDSVLMQETAFDYEIIIGEDCSTDRTRAILMDYQHRYPDKVRLLLPEKNLGPRRNYVQVYEACGGQYVAMLEGDDYWTAPSKLQKQVDFLDAHPDFAMCVHPVQVVYENVEGQSFVTAVNPRKDCTIEDVIEYRYPLPTAGTMLRNGLVREFPAWFFDIHNGDYAVHILTAQYGKVRYLDEAMAVYMKHPGGISEATTVEYRCDQLIKLYQLMNQHLGFKYDRLFRRKLGPVLRSKSKCLFKRGDYFNGIRHLARAVRYAPRTVLKLP